MDITEIGLSLESTKQLIIIILIGAQFPILYKHLQQPLMMCGRKLKKKKLKNFEL
jgi:hypothetical protein